MEDSSRSKRENRIDVKRLLNYQSVVKQVPFFLFLATLGVIYIYNGHLADRTIRNIISTGNQLKDLQSEYKSVKGEALLKSRQSKIVSVVETMGLKELVEEPFVLIDSSEAE